jgi:quercetin 2,3-dioxygenase
MGGKEAAMKSLPRKIETIIEPEPVVEGAGVRLKRSIATRRLDYLDPFLLLDHFASSNPRDYEAGFPLHPHRGIETVTYVLRGEVHHKDTLGNSGSIGAGDVQWMTAGRGIMHEEMPQVSPEGIAGFQLWVNLPAKLKMTKPRYQDIRSGEIPEIKKDNGARIRVITGTVDGVSGPVTGIAANPIYLDVFVPARASLVQPIHRGHTAFAYVFEGEAKFAGDEKDDGTMISHPRLVVLGDGDYVKVITGATPVRFLLVSGKPLHEPIARYGPFVMNTEEEIEQTLEELRQGTFVTT